MRRLLFLLLIACIGVLMPRLARADQVVVLPFKGAGGTDGPILEEVRAATRAAVAQTNHALASDSQTLTAEMAIKSGNGTMQEYSAAGHASGSDWTATGRVDSRGATYHLELVVCRVDAGAGAPARVETLDRDIEPAKQVGQIAEMLALLLRPEGIANADIPWEHAGPHDKKPPPKEEKKAPEPPKPPPGPPPVRHGYAEGHPLSLGVALAVLTAVHRADNATGTATSMNLGGAVGYALGVPGLELRAEVMGSLAGPQSIAADAGARYMFPVVPTARFFMGPELDVGVFGTLGGEKTGRFLLRSGFLGSLGLGDRVQLELVADLDYAAGGTASLLLAGATLRGAVRF